MPSDPIADFFQRIEQLRREPRIAPVNAAIRFEVVDGQAPGRWLVKLTEGDILVSSEDRPADVVVRVSRGVFCDLVTNRANILQTWLQGKLLTTGNPTWLITLWQIPGVIPPPPDADHPREFVRRKARERASSHS